MQDVVAEMGPAFLGSRLKRLGERMQTSAAHVISAAGLPLQPGHMAVLAALRSGPLSIGRLAELIGTSQPGITRTVRQLTDLGIVTDRACTDQRSRVVGLSESGVAAAQVAGQDVWPRVGQAAEQLLGGTMEEFLRNLGAIEAALSEATIAERARWLDPGQLRLREYDDALAPLFQQINAEWISSMFKLEQTDREVLENPRERIIATGGAILFVEAPGLGIVGTCALQKTGPCSFELTKMGVREVARGLKAGEFLLAAVIARAAELGADPLYLLTNSKCAAAVHLYEKLGFAHDAGIMAQFGTRYARCNVAMRHVGVKQLS